MHHGPRNYCNVFINLGLALCPTTLSSERGADLLSAGAKDGGIPNANERLVMERGK